MPGIFRRPAPVNFVSCWNSLAFWFGPKIAGSGGRKVVRQGPPVKMDNALYVGLSQQMVLRREMEIIANNIANLDTTGFKVESLMQKTDARAPAMTLGGPKPVKLVFPKSLPPGVCHGAQR